MWKNIFSSRNIIIVTLILKDVFIYFSSRYCRKRVKVVIKLNCISYKYEYE